MLQDIYDKGFSAIEKSHQRATMEMRKTHKQELDKLRMEKDQLLAEEAQATQAGQCPSGIACDIGQLL